MATGLPRVTIQPTRDLTYRVPPRGGTGVGCIVVNARKGPVDEPVFVANETEYLRTFCPDETISVGDDEAHYSALNFLREGAGLWVVRPNPTSSYYAALRVDAETSSNRGNYGLTTGAGTAQAGSTLESLLNGASSGNIYTIYAKSPGKWGNNISVAFAETEDDTLDLPSLDFRKKLGDAMPHTFTIPAVPGQTMSPQTVFLPTGITGTPTVTGSAEGGVRYTESNPQGGGQFEFTPSTGMFRYQARTTNETVRVYFSPSWSSSAIVPYTADVVSGDDSQVIILPDDLEVSSGSNISHTAAAGIPPNWTSIANHLNVNASGEYALDGTDFWYYINVEGKATVTLASAVAVEVTSTGGGTGAMVTATVVDGAVTGFNVTNGGSGYAAGTTTVTVNGTGSGATAGNVTVSSGAIDAVALGTGGSGYVTQFTVNLTHINARSMAGRPISSPWFFTGSSITSVTMSPSTTFAADASDPIAGDGQWNLTGSKLLLRYDGAEAGTLAITTDFNLPRVTLTPGGSGIGALSIGDDSRIEEIVSISLADNRRLTSRGTGPTQFQHPVIDPATGSNSLVVTAPTDINLRGATVFGKYRTAEEKSRARQLIVSYKGPGDDAPVEQERFTVSHYKDLKDSYGRSVYASDSTASSKYIAVKVNAGNTANIPMKTIVYAENPTDGASPQESTTGSVAQERTLSQGADGNGLEGRGKLSSSGDLYEKLVDVDNYGFSYIMDGGEDGIRGTLAKIAKERKDCVAVLSANPDGDGVAATGTATTAAALKGGEGTKNSFAAMYSPHVEIYDKFNDRNLIVPPDGFAAAVMARTARNNRPWTAPAGSDYGSLRSFPIVSLAHRYSEKLAGNLYDRSINPIIFKPGEGHLIFGQKTTQLRPSALDRLNVRLLMNETLTRIKGFLTTVVFKENDIQTRSVIRTRVGSYMARVQAGRGVYSYQVVCDETNNLPEDIDSNVLNVWVMMQPRRTAEYVNLLGVLTPTGASFSEAQGQL